MKQALEALESDPTSLAWLINKKQAITALRQALVDADDTSQERVDETVKCKHEWVGLTDEEINSVRHNRDWTADWTDTTFARAIEAKLREKNHG
jgi:low affinity Fe/Cu permease